MFDNVTFGGLGSRIKGFFDFLVDFAENNWNTVSLSRFVMYVRLDSRCHLFS